MAIRTTMTVVKTAKSIPTPKLLTPPPSISARKASTSYVSGFTREIPCNQPGMTLNGYIALLAKNSGIVKI